MHSVGVVPKVSRFAARSRAGGTQLSETDSKGRSFFENHDAVSSGKNRNVDDIMQSRLAVIMFADIVGFSARMEADQAGTVRIVRALRSETFEPVITAHGGQILKRLGDGWIIGFASVAACVDGAMQAQKALLSVPGVHLRVGCHIGDIVQDDEDIYGSGINIAERIQAEAPPGGVMVSEDVHRQLSGAAAGALREAGVFRLKNISAPVRLYQWRPADQTSANTGEATSIAVAAIEYAPRDADTAAIAGDLREQLFVRLSRRTGIVVYDASARDVGDATYDLRSRLRVAGDRGRLSLTLVLRSDGRPVWSESYDRSTADIFDFCDGVLERAESDLRLQTNAFDGDRLAHIPDEALSVSELRSRAAQLFYRVSYESWIHGRNLMRRALQLNPGDGVALAMLAEAEVMLAAARYEQVPQDLSEELARGLDHAVEQNPGSDYVFWARGIFRVICTDDIRGARADLESSRRNNPAYTEAHELEGHILMAEGDCAGAARQFEVFQNQSQNPLLPNRLFLNAVALYCDGRAGEAMTLARRAADVRPGDRVLHAMVARAARAAGDNETADRYRARADGLDPAPSICARAPLVPEAHQDLVRALAREQRPG